MSTAVALQEMTCGEAAEYDPILAVLDTIIQEDYWDGGCDTDYMFHALKREANKHGITLTDVEAWDYDTYFYELYRCTEKGLS